MTTTKHAFATCSIVVMFIVGCNLPEAVSEGDGRKSTQTDERATGPSDPVVPRTMDYESEVKEPGTTPAPPVVTPVEKAAASFTVYSESSEGYGFTDFQAQDAQIHAGMVVLLDALHDIIPNRVYPLTIPFNMFPRQKLSRFDDLVEAA